MNKQKRTFFSQLELNRIRHSQDIVNSKIKRAGKKGKLHPTIFACGCNSPGGCGYVIPLNEDGHYEEI